MSASALLLIAALLCMILAYRNSRQADSMSTCSWPALLPAASGLYLAAAGIIDHAHRNPFDTSLSPQFWQLLVWHDYTAALLLGLLTLTAACLPIRAGFGSSLLAWLAQHPWKVSALLFVIACAAARTVYMAHPLSMDEYSASFQAQVFASGRLATQYPPDWMPWLFDKGFHGGFFALNFNTGEVSSNYWPGFALLLTPFAWLGIPWAGNPALLALSYRLLHTLASHLFDSPRSVGWVLLLALASPVFLIDGISYYAMSAHLLLNLAYCVLLLRTSPTRLFAAGLVGSLAAALHNPLPHTLFALPWLIWILRSQGWRSVLILAAGYSPALLLLFGWTGWMMGMVTHGQDALPSAAAATNVAVHDIGASVQRIIQLPTPETLERRFYGTLKALLWAAPALPLLAVYGLRGLSSAYWRRLAASLLLTYFGYFLSRFDQGHGWGYRYLHSAWFILPLLAVRAIEHYDTNLPRAAAAGSGRLLVAILAGMALLLPLRLWQVSDFIRTHLAQSPLHAINRPDVSLVEFMNAGPNFRYDLVQHHPDLHGNNLHLLSHGEAENERFLSRHFRGHRRLWQHGGASLYVVSGRSGTASTGAVMLPP